MMMETYIHYNLSFAKAHSCLLSLSDRSPKYFDMSYIIINKKRHPNRQDAPRNHFRFCKQG